MKLTFCVCGSASPGWKQLELAKVQFSYDHCSQSEFVNVFIGIQPILMNCGAEGGPEKLTIFYSMSHCESSYNFYFHLYGTDDVF